MSTLGTNHPCCDRPHRGSLTGPLVLITLGVLFLLSEFHIAYFHDTWPVLLIVAGIGVLLQRSGVLDGKDSSEVNHV